MSLEASPEFYSRLSYFVTLNLTLNFLGPWFSGVGIGVGVGIILLLVYRFLGSWLLLSMTFVFWESCCVLHKVSVTGRRSARVRHCVTRTYTATRTGKPYLLILTGKWRNILMNNSQCLRCKHRYHLKQPSHFRSVLQWLSTIDSFLAATSDFLNKSSVSQKEDWKHISTSPSRTVISEKGQGGPKSTGQWQCPTGGPTPVAGTFSQWRHSQT